MKAFGRFLRILLVLATGLTHIPNVAAGLNEDKYSSSTDSKSYYDQLKVNVVKKPGGYVIHVDHRSFHSDGTALPLLSAFAKILDRLSEAGADLNDPADVYWEFRFSHMDMAQELRWIELQNLIGIGTAYAQSDKFILLIKPQETSWDRFMSGFKQYFSFNYSKDKFLETIAKNLIVSAGAGAGFRYIYEVAIGVIKEQAMARIFGALLAAFVIEQLAERAIDWYDSWQKGEYEIVGAQVAAFLESAAYFLLGSWSMGQFIKANSNFTIFSRELAPPPIASNVPKSSSPPPKKPFGSSQVPSMKGKGVKVNPKSQPTFSLAQAEAANKLSSSAKNHAPKDPTPSPANVKPTESASSEIYEIKTPSANAQPALSNELHSVAKFPPLIFKPEDKLFLSEQLKLSDQVATGNHMVRVEGRDYILIPIHAGALVELALYQRSVLLNTHLNKEQQIHYPKSELWSIQVFEKGDAQRRVTRRVSMVAQELVPTKHLIPLEKTGALPSLATYFTWLRASLVKSGAVDVFGSADKKSGYVLKPKYLDLSPSYSKVDKHVAPILRDMQTWDAIRVLPLPQALGANSLSYEHTEAWAAIQTFERLAFANLMTDGHGDNDGWPYNIASARGRAELFHLWGQVPVRSEEKAQFEEAIKKYIRNPHEKTLFQRALEGDRNIQVISEMRRLHELCQKGGANAPSSEICQFVEEYLGQALTSLDRFIDATISQNRSIFFAVLKNANEFEDLAFFILQVGRAFIAIPFSVFGQKIFAKIAGLNYDKESNTITPISSARGLGYVLQHLLFELTDFEGKRILFVGNGFSRAPQLLNILLGKTGTFAQGLDLAVKGPRYLTWRHIQIIANALKMDSIADLSQDYTLATWFMDYFMPKVWDRASASVEKDILKKLLNELLRVTKSGGQIRFSLGHKVPNRETVVGGDGYRFGLKFLRTHARVKNVREKDVGMQRAIIVELK